MDRVLGICNIFPLEFVEIVRCVKSVVFWNVMLCSPVVQQCFRSSHCLPLHQKKKKRQFRCLLLAHCLLCLLLDFEIGSGILLQDFSEHLLEYTDSHSRRWYSLWSSL